MSNQEVYEERPKAQANKRVTKDPKFEYILCQVTQNDINAGDSKMTWMLRDGWAKVDVKAEPDKSTGTDDNYFYMKRPWADIREARQKATDQWQNQMKAPLSGGNGIKEIGTRDNEQLTHQETEALAAAASAANS